LHKSPESPSPNPSHKGRGKGVGNLFLTATDTAVGKTVVAAAIAAHLREQGLSVGVMKPAETGCCKRGGALHPSDADFLRRASATDDVLGAICPYRFSEPLAPAVAARRAKKEIDTRLIRKIYRAISKGHNTTLVEGAGGLMVPLCGSYLYLDLAAELGLPLVIVARAGLGTINHTLLTVNAARARGLEIYGIILNQARKGKLGPAEKTNPGAIAELTGISRVFSLPYIPGVKRSRAGLIKAGAALARQGFFGLTIK